MAVLQLAARQQLAGVQLETVWNYYCAGGGVNDFADVFDVASEWIDTVGAALNDLQSERITNIEVYARNVYDVSTAQTIAWAGGGVVIATSAETLPPYLPIGLKLNVGSTFNTGDNTPYVGGRPIRRGFKYLPGLTEAWVNENGAIAPAALETLFATFQSALNDPIVATTTSREFVPCIFSPGLPALSPSVMYPAGRPPRGPVYAPILTSTLRNPTRLKSRSD